MDIKTINSTEAQNNFGQLLDDVSEKGTQYLIQRFGKVKAVIIPLDDFRRLMAQDDQAARLLRETNPQYSLGQPQTEDAVQQLIEPENGDK
jgi:prevent-host-death family protein